MAELKPLTGRIEINDQAKCYQLLMCSRAATISLYVTTWSGTLVRLDYWENNAANPQKSEKKVLILGMCDVACCTMKFNWCAVDVVCASVDILYLTLHSTCGSPYHGSPAVSSPGSCGLPPAAYRCLLCLAWLSCPRGLVFPNLLR